MQLNISSNTSATCNTSKKIVVYNTVLDRDRFKNKYYWHYELDFYIIYL